jgi:hypothetical protein
VSFAIPYIPSRLIVPLGDLGTLATLASIEAAQDSKWNIVGIIIGSAGFFAWRLIKAEKDVAGVRKATNEGDSKQQEEINALKLENANRRAENAELKGQIVVVQQTMQRILETMLNASKNT